MTMVVNPFSVAPSGPTYASFMAHIATLTANTRGTFSGIEPITTRVTLNALPTTMEGTPWAGNGMGDNTTFGAMLRHALPSEAEVNAQVAAAREIYVGCSAVGTGDVNAALRNGFMSADATGVTVHICSKARYWNATLNRAEEMTPQAGGGPSVYNF